MENKFKFSIDDERPDTLLKTKRETQRIDKLNRRITSVFIFLIVLWGGTLTAGYFLVYKNFGITQEVDSHKIETLSQDIQSKYSVLSKQFATIEGTVNNMNRSLGAKGYPDEVMIELEKTASALRDQISESRDQIAKLEKSIQTIAETKLDKQELQAEIQKKLDPVLADLKKTEADISKVNVEVKSLDEKFARELVRIAEKIH